MFKLIFGTGNFFNQYRNTPHNIGSDIVFNYLRKYHTMREIRTGCLWFIVNDKDTFFVIPDIDNDNTGEYLKEILEKRNIKLSQVLTITNDINLNVGEIKIKGKGSSGGNSALKSIIKEFGTTNFARMRVGIKIRKIEDINFLIEPYIEEDKETYENIIDTTSVLLNEILGMNDFNSIVQKINTIRKYL